ncbi:MAG: lysophospholipid acyltransferase family protein [Candidatus Sericytochromatia bacterium]|nr:lysophospholipid acyltransferase family protein [Candidatus Sericytochromatia bacterium]
MFGQAFLNQVCLALATLARRLPRDRALAIADGVAGVLWRAYRLTPWRGHLHRVLRGAALPEADLGRVARAHVRELARNIVELLRLPLFPVERHAVVAGVTGWEHVVAAVSAGRGVIVATAHYGNWEVLGAELAARGLVLHVLVQPPSQPAFDRLFQEARGAVGVRTWANAGAASLRPVVRALRAGEALGLLADQHGESQEAIVRLFGRPVSAPTGVFALARRTGAAVLPMRLVRGADDRHWLHVEPALPPSGDVEADMQALYAAYERWIRERPEHWLWVHDRWAREAELRSVGPEPRVAVAPAPAGGPA